ncbi:hypothetical protein [Kaarinaea lacus]
MANVFKPMVCSLVAFGVIALLFFTGAVVAQPSNEENHSVAQEENHTQVIQAFTSEEAKNSDIVSIDDQTKGKVMFFMGVPLLVLLLVTGALGIAMGVYGKQVFVAHMLFAGLSMTLAIAHAVVGLVWFYPF